MMERDVDNGAGGRFAFLGEPAYRWIGFAIAATLFLFVWGRVIKLLAESVE